MEIEARDEWSVLQELYHQVIEHSPYDTVKRFTLANNLSAVNNEKFGITHAHIEFLKTHGFIISAIQVKIGQNSAFLNGFYVDLNIQNFLKHFSSFIEQEVPQDRIESIYINILIVIELLRRFRAYQGDDANLELRAADALTKAVTTILSDSAKLHDVMYFPQPIGTLTEIRSADENSHSTQIAALTEYATQYAQKYGIDKAVKRPFPKPIIELLNNLGRHRKKEKTIQKVRRFFLNEKVRFEEIVFEFLEPTQGSLDIKYGGRSFDLIRSEKVNIHVKGHESQTFSIDDFCCLNLKTESTVGRPKTEWLFLLLLLKWGGELPGTSGDYDRRFKKAKQALNSILKQIFDLTEDAFFEYETGYRIKIRLMLPREIEVRHQTEPCGNISLSLA